MKALLLAMLLSGATPVLTAGQILVETGSVRTVRGIGGNADLGYAFAKGDEVTLAAKGSKKLQLVLAFMYPESPVLGRVKSATDAKLRFTMPEDGIVIFRFISDRPGVNTVSYTVTRTPASEATRAYNTKIEWVKPTDRVGPPVPKRVE